MNTIHIWTWFLSSILSPGKTPSLYSWGNTHRTLSSVHALTKQAAFPGRDSSGLHQTNFIPVHQDCSSIISYSSAFNIPGVNFAYTAYAPKAPWTTLYLCCFNHQFFPSSPGIIFCLTSLHISSIYHEYWHIVKEMC